MGRGRGRPGTLDATLIRDQRPKIEDQTCRKASTTSEISETDRSFNRASKLCRRTGLGLASGVKKADDEGPGTANVAILAIGAVIGAPCDSECSALRMKDACAQSTRIEVRMEEDGRRRRIGRRKTRNEPT
ncbi:hypothetical protein PRIPAC_90275 [Pristionchus pacificus]|uniref:Uncharacterized protein n=1 Tax=Pristionchus pacificus TaxID=54126 RepID=A0A2A6CZE0_PRIPA|nr:hypothetical protein PRIPAC_90275 [Pristionchus pacificus]|eukprot:PDM83393.1 hypothetical protein PRIPAC_35025 [Pristionchus pacificus]